MYKTCPQCEKTFKTHSSKQKFCSMECFRAWQRDHASRSDQAKKRRRRDLLRKRIRGQISEEEYERRRDQFREEGLI